jgi:hypothetical protein
MIKEYPETHQDGSISLENPSSIFDVIITRAWKPVIQGDLGIQIAEDGRVWVCINGISFLRSNPTIEKEKPMTARKATRAIAGKDEKTNMWYAFCYVTEMGHLVQWGATEVEAKDNLKRQVEDLKAEWSEAE